MNWLGLAGGGGLPSMHAPEGYQKIWEVVCIEQGVTYLLSEGKTMTKTKKSRWGRTTDGGWSKILRDNGELRIRPAAHGRVIFGIWEDGEFLTWEWASDEGQAKRMLKSAGYDS